MKKFAVATITTAALETGVAVTQLPYFVGENVVSVIDGDSFKIENDQTIRLATLDAPDNKYCYGPEATKALTKKILNKKVILRDLKTDRYGRIMAMVYQNGEIIIEKNMGEEWFYNINQAVKAGFSESPSCSRKIPNT